MVTTVFNILIFLSLVSVGVNTGMDMFDIIFFRTGIIILFMASFIDKPRREMPKAVKNLLFTLIGLCLFSIFTSTFSPNVMAATMTLFLGIMGFCIVYIHYNEKQSIKYYALAAAGLCLLLFILQRFGFDPVFDRGMWQNAPTGAMEDGGLMGNAPRMMTFFSLIAPLVWWPLLIIGFFLAEYTHQIIIIIPIILICLSKFKKTREKIIFGILCLIVLFVFKDKILYSLKYRFDVSYKPILSALFDRPFLGFGLGLRPIPELEVVGSSYLQFIIGVGLMGLVWLGYAFKSLYKCVKNNIESLCFVTLAIIMTIEYPCEIPRLWFLIMGIITMFLINNYKEAK